jgi:hypothetical protein
LRRGLYTTLRRTAIYPSMLAFDAPSRELSIVRRPRSDTPLQALTTLNDPAYFEAAQAMARRILKEAGAENDARAIYGFRLATSRQPKATELSALRSSLAAELQYFDRKLDEARAVSGKADAELAAWTIVSRALLNLDETLTRH